jgi:hypothetical protein
MRAESLCSTRVAFSSPITFTDPTPPLLLPSTSWPSITPMVARTGVSARCRAQGHRRPRGRRGARWALHSCEAATSCASSLHRRRNHCHSQGHESRSSVITTRTHEHTNTHESSHQTPKLFTSYTAATGQGAASAASARAAVAAPEKAAPRAASNRELTNHHIHTSHPHLPLGRLHVRLL